ncbi:hypothetical protein DL96DRAFT_1624365, partial [Flagelloscypha sp. PMI_526]
MLSVKSSNRRTVKKGTSAIDLPFELWEVVLGDMSKGQLWKIRSLNRSVYSFAARSMYGTISLAPRSGMPGSVYDVLERICDTKLQIAGLVHTVHLHSNFEAYIPPKTRVKRNASGTDLLDTAILTNPHIRVLNLTIHCAIWVRLYASLAWQKFADTLVHLELQFFTSSVLRAIPQNVCCRHLKGFSLTCSDRPFPWNNTIRPRLLDFRSEGPTPIPDASIIVSIFTSLKSILPSELLSLGLYSYSHPDGIWALDPSFLHPNSFPHLEELHLSSPSIDNDPVMLPFLLSRVGKLRNLSIRSGTNRAQSPLRDLPVSSNLQELLITYNVFCEVFSLRVFGSGHSSRAIRSCTNLRRLSIGENISLTQAFYLLVELARGESQVEQLFLSISELDLRLFRTTLLLLPRIADLTLADVRSRPWDVSEFSTRPDVWNEPSWRSPCTYRLIGLGKAATRLGRGDRQAMAKELRKNIDHFYQLESRSEQEKFLFLSSVKKAYIAAKVQVRSNLPIEVVAQNHKWATVQLVEDCLVDLH